MFIKVAKSLWEQPNDTKICPKLPKMAKFDESCQWLPKYGKSHIKLPTHGKNCQILQKKSCQKMQKVARKCQKFSKIVKTF